jgi:hypothetical protein
MAPSLRCVQISTGLLVLILDSHQRFLSTHYILLYSVHSDNSIITWSSLKSLLIIDFFNFKLCLSLNEYSIPGTFTDIFTPHFRVQAML